MQATLDCIPCIVRQALDSARFVSADLAVHERLVLEVLCWVKDIDLKESPPLLGQRLHRRLREITGIQDPYGAAKERFNQKAMKLLPGLRAMIATAPDPLGMAVRLAAAGNVIDMGLNIQVTESDIRQALTEALAEPVAGLQNGFRQAVAKARAILYLADNAGEIAFDRLLIEQLRPAQVTVVVRGVPVINDATVADARDVGLHEIAEIVDNGSDAPGTILEDCSPDFVRRFHRAELIIAKGQGNFETLSEQAGNILFLFKAKCPVIAAHVGSPVGSCVLAQPDATFLNSERSGSSNRNGLQ